MHTSWQYPQFQGRRTLFNRRSRAGIAFERSLALPVRPKPDWAAAQKVLAAEGSLPAESPEPDYPVAFVREWFLAAGADVDDCAVLAAAHAIYSADNRLWVDLEFRRSVAEMSGRHGTGHRTEARKAFESIARASRCLLDELNRMRFDLVYHRITGGDARDVHEGFICLHEAFLDGSSRSQQATVDVVDARAVARAGVGASLAQTWLMSALHCMSIEADLLSGEHFSLSSARQPRAGPRRSFLVELCRIWENATGEKATARGPKDEGTSPFQVFLECVWGHAAASFCKRSASQRGLDQHDEQTVAAARRAGLGAVPSASTIRTALKESQV